MKNLNIKDYRFVKQVFTELKNNFQNNSKYPLGEDFYSFITDEKEIKINDSSNIKLSNELNT